MIRSPHNIKFLSLTMISAIVLILSGCEKKYAEDESKVAINEIMPSNLSTVADPAGEYDDWIELFNKSSEEQNISGWYLSDSKSNYTKFRFPENTKIPGNGYIVIWADGDTSQTGLHAGFKLSAEGEKVVLSYPDGNKADLAEYPASSLELSYSRYPDGTGPFRWQLPTFGKSNNENHLK